MQNICYACNGTYQPKIVGQPFCDDCHTDHHTLTARSNLAAGGLTTTPLPNPSGVLKGTSKTRKANP